MNETQSLYSHGCLVYISQDNHSISLTAFRLNSAKQLSCIAETRGLLHTSEQKWVLNSCANCVDCLTGDVIVCLLASRLDDKESFRLFNVRLDDCGVMDNRRLTLNKPTVGRLEISSWAEFCSVPGDLDVHAHKTILVNGPCVLFLKGNRLTIVFRRLNESKITKQDLTIFYEDRTKTGNRLTSTILCVKSDEDWIVIIILIQRKCEQSRNIDSRANDTVQAVALERGDNDENFLLKTLPNKAFFPEEYAAKISAALIKSCQKSCEKDTANEAYYKTDCVIGLIDGYVLLFHHGNMQACIMLQSTGQDCYHGLQHFVVERIWNMESASVLICHTSSKECFVVSIINHKVNQTWSKVKEVLIGDFLQRGGQQLLLLFDSWSLQQPDTEFLLTDLQGFVLDKRHHSLTVSNKSTSSIQQKCAFSALIEQNKTIVRHTAEEEQRLVTKEIFLQEFWQHLQTLSLCQKKASPELPQPEVPLIPLVGKKYIYGRHPSGLHNLREDIEVSSVWHRVIDDLPDEIESKEDSSINKSFSEDSVDENKDENSAEMICKQHMADLGEKRLFQNSVEHNSFWIYKTVHFQYGLRLLWGLHLSLHTSSSVHQFQTALSSTSKTWNFCDRELSSSVKTCFDSGKRLHLEPRLLIQQVNSLLPGQAATVTCMFLMPSLGLSGDIECLLYLHAYSPQCNGARLYSHSPSEQANPKDECWDGIELQPSVSSNLCQPFGGRTSEESESGLQEERKMVCCGTLTLKAQDEIMKPMNLLQPMQGPAFRNGDFLAMAATQSSWSILVTFHLHDPSIIKSCIEGAGLEYQEHVGHYIFLQMSASFLHLTRIAVTDIAWYPKKQASLLVFAKDSNQMFMLLRHLISHLPDDAIISSQGSQRQRSHFECLIRTMSAELSLLKKHLQALLPSHQLSPKAPQETDNCAAKPGAFSPESETFAQVQKHYWQKQEYLLKGSAVQSFFSIAEECQRETDKFMAKLCSKT